jgi:hypothetical protein
MHMFMQSDFIEFIKSYILPADVLPLSQHRQLFAVFNPVALNHAAQMALDYPEKRGVLSYATRKIAQLENAAPSKENHMVIEIHLDARSLLPELANEFLTLGFEPDGFHQFMPREYATHMTMKFKFPQKDYRRHRIIYEFVKKQFEKSQELLVKEYPHVEAYLEWEIYNSANRRYWNSEKIMGEWQKDFPLGPNSMRVEEIPRNPGCAVVKKADIHIKIGKVGLAGEKIEPDHELGRALIAGGFYRVITWAENEIFTAQFTKVHNAKIIFDTLANFFNRHGGAMEMTMEPTRKFWRTTNPTPRGPLQAEVPPVVTAVYGFE